MVWGFWAAINPATVQPNKKMGAFPALSGPGGHGFDLEELLGYRRCLCHQKGRLGKHEVLD